MALLCSAYLNLKQGDFGVDPWLNDPYPRIMYFCALGVSFILAWLAATRFFGKNKFEMSYWGYTFPLATMAIVTLQYHSEIDTHLTEVSLNSPAAHALRHSHSARTMQYITPTQYHTTHSHKQHHTYTTHTLIRTHSQTDTTQYIQDTLMLSHTLHTHPYTTHSPSHTYSRNLSRLWRFFL